MSTIFRRILFSRAILSRVIINHRKQILIPNIPIQKWYSSSPAHVPHCLGCGAPFQSEYSNKPGYLPPVTNATTSANAYKVSNPDKQISNQEYESLLHTLDPALKQHFHITADHAPPTESQLNREVKRSKQTICQRCFHLTRYNSMKTDWKTNAHATIDSLQFLKNQPRSVIVKVVDILDLENTLIKDLPAVLDGRKFVLVCNKVDLLPSVINNTQTMEYVYKTLRAFGLKEYVLDVHLISARHNRYMSKLVSHLRELTKGESDIYLIGYTNVGKSQLMNKLLHSEVQKKSKLTTSLVPGTTMKLVGIPGNQLHPHLGFTNGKQNHLFDTPGIHNDRSILHYLTYPEILTCSPKKDELKLCTNKFLPSRSFFLGGLLRLDNLSTETLVISNFTKIPFHRTHSFKGERLTKNRNMGLVSDVLTPPFFEYEPRVTALPTPKLIQTDPLVITKESPEPEHSIDIVLSGIGWLSISTKLMQGKSMEIIPYTLDGQPLQVRKAMIPSLPCKPTKTKIYLKVDTKWMKKMQQMQ